MYNLPIMNMLDGQTDLRKPIQYLILMKMIALGLPYNFIQVATISILHDDVEVTFCFEKEEEFYDMGVIEY